MGVIRETARKQIASTHNVLAALEFLCDTSSKHQQIRRAIFDFYVNRAKMRADEIGAADEWAFVENQHPVKYRAESEQDGTSNQKTLKLTKI